MQSRCVFNTAVDSARRIFFSKQQLAVKGRILYIKIMERDYNWIARLPEIVKQAVEGCMRERKLASGEVIFHVGDKPNALYQILEGYVDATNVSVEGKEILFHVMGVGDCFGEGGLIENCPRNITAKARGPTRLAILSDVDFQHLRQIHPVINNALLELQSRRLRLAMESLGSSTLFSLRNQIIRRLYITAIAFGEDRGNGVFVDIDMSQEEWGKMLGVSRQSINKELKAFERQNFLQQQADGILIYDLEALTDILEQDNNNP